MVLLTIPSCRAAPGPAGECRAKQPVVWKASVTLCSSKVLELSN